MPLGGYRTYDLSVSELKLITWCFSFSNCEQWQTAAARILTTANTAHESNWWNVAQDLEPKKRPRNITFLVHHLISVWITAKNRPWPELREWSRKRRTRWRCICERFGVAGVSTPQPLDSNTGIFNDAVALKIGKNFRTISGHSARQFATLF